MARPKKIDTEAVESSEDIVLEDVAVVEGAVDVAAVNPKLVTESLVVCKDENGEGGKLVNGIVSADGKSVTTLAGVTFAL